MLGHWSFQPSCRVRIAVGLSNQGKSCQTIRSVGVNAALATIRKRAVQQFPLGHTFVRAKGGWRCSRRGSPRTISEDTILVELVGVGPHWRGFQRKGEAFARWLARVFRQDSVLMQVTQPNGRTCVAFVTKRGHRDGNRKDTSAPACT